MLRDIYAWVISCLRHKFSHKDPQIAAFKDFPVLQSPKRVYPHTSLSQSCLPLLATPCSLGHAALLVLPHSLSRASLSQSNLTLLVISQLLLIFLVTPHSLGHTLLSWLHLTCSSLSWSCLTLSVMPCSLTHTLLTSQSCLALSLTPGSLTHAWLLCSCLVLSLIPGSLTCTLAVLRILGRDVSRCEWMQVNENELFWPPPPLSSKS